MPASLVTAGARLAPRGAAPTASRASRVVRASAHTAPSAHDADASVSLGDARSFYLTTAGDDLGVVRATHGTSRATMLPIGWTEVQCPVTGEVEDRKVARVDE